ncbi:hypothetical protein ACWIID_14670 [Streptomyces phaeochromogenes]|uniref:hypothetical protein n=1 Tax=Streptomyces umbrinus TaxID=67370 RepID=UPI0016730BF9|nr:hypothetical protein [Streptomyces umbrinus]GHB31693.1 hypothetical protein GCM10010306_025990 [Streptomyces umbrinus]
MVPLILLAATVLGACLIFGYSSFVVGFILMAAGLLGLITFLGTIGAKRPGERGSVVEERHYIGNPDERRHYHS